MYPFDQDPYLDFDYSKFANDPQGWGGHDEFFRKMIKLAKVPESGGLIIEVGSWKGKSAIAMAKILDEIYSMYDEKPAQILCIDTWLGATEFVDKPTDDPKRGLRRVNGYPMIYYQFLANVMYACADSRIVPFPQTSTNAARYLESNGVQADLIYVDASHEYEDVANDLSMYGRLLKPGGLMFGDDYCEYWRGVTAAVDEYAYYNDMVVTHKRYENADEEAPSDYWLLSDNGVEL